MREVSSEFVQHLAERLYAAFRSSFEPRSFTEILADVHANGFCCDAERESWEAVASIIVDHREDVEFDDLLEPERRTLVM
jgi:hypothetical protein